jgi:hypothetical protein
MDDSGCLGLAQAAEAGHVRFYPKEPQNPATQTNTGDPVSYFVKILSGLGRTPSDYLTFNNGSKPTTMFLGKSAIDPDDSQLWDFYEVWCPKDSDVVLPPDAEQYHVKVYPKEPPVVLHPPPNTPVSFVVKVLTGLGTTPKDYVAHNPTIIPMNRAIVDPNDGKTWDWYTVWCPTGPPCLTLQQLFAGTDNKYK